MNESVNRRTLARVNSGLTHRADDHVSEVARRISISLSYVAPAEKFRPTWKLAAFVVAIEVLIGLAVVGLLGTAR
jgi:hypothetical protein